MPGDTIQFMKGELFINEKIIRNFVNDNLKIRCGNFTLETNVYLEILPNGVEYLTVYKKEGSLQNSQKYKVSSGHYFLLEITVIVQEIVDI